VFWSWLWTSALGTAVVVAAERKMEETGPGTKQSEKPEQGHAK